MTITSSTSIGINVQFDNNVSVSLTLRQEKIASDNKDYKMFNLRNKGSTWHLTGIHQKGAGKCTAVKISKFNASNNTHLKSFSRTTHLCNLTYIKQGGQCIEEKINTQDLLKYNKASGIKYDTVQTNQEKISFARSFTQGMKDTDYLGAKNRNSHSLYKLDEQNTNPNQTKRNIVAFIQQFGIKDESEINGLIREAFRYTHKTINKQDYKAFTVKNFNNLINAIELHLETSSPQKSDISPLETKKQEVRDKLKSNHKPLPPLSPLPPLPNSNTEHFLKGKIFKGII